MQYQFEFHPYQRQFTPPLKTSYGSWDVREGVIIHISNQGQTGYGEIAPISWFGSETIEQALDFCRQLPTQITEEIVFSIPTELPACQFGFESAWEALNTPLHVPSRLKYSALLPAGEAALHAWQELWQQGHCTFKWKIGVYPVADELNIFRLLTQALPVTAKLRLDANGGLNYDTAHLWLRTCDDNLLIEIEFIEQPLPVEQFQQMQELSSCYATPIALDESVATLIQLEACYQQGWREIFVIKPSIVGSPKKLRQFCQTHKIDAVFSSVFETAVGRQAALKLAVELFDKPRAVGFGINHWFDEQDST